MRRFAALLLTVVLPSCGGSSGGGTTPNTVPAVAQATATPIPPTPTAVPPTPTPQTGGGGGGGNPRPTATPRSTAGICNGVQAPNSCQVGNGPPPATARCNDGLWSCSQNRSGTCSGHGGVACWVCPGPLC
jgi:hypothetical protein